MSTEQEPNVSGHTPGPWHVDPDWRTDGSDQVCQSNGHTVAFIATGRDEDEHYANAVLIAAAPELLAACKAIVAMAVQWQPLSLGDIADVRAAIAKAEGDVSKESPPQP